MNRAVFVSLGTWRSAEDTANGRRKKKAMFGMGMCRESRLRRCLNVGPTGDMETITHVPPATA